MSERRTYYVHAPRLGRVGYGPPAGAWVEARSETDARRRGAVAISRETYERIGADDVEIVPGASCADPDDETE